MKRYVAFRIVPAISDEVIICGEDFRKAFFILGDTVYCPGEYPGMMTAGSFVLSVFESDR